MKAQPENTVDTILQAGQIVDGKYRVDRLLGRGGMAAVWGGTNERTGKRVALKVILRPLAATHEAQHLLHSEALAASRVNHPNVVTVFDVIEHEGMTCIVMELLDGEPLGSYIARNGFLSVGEAAAVLLPAMRGVAAANAQGVVHRDLKPQNIFICIEPDGRIVTTKVLDFGISVMVERVMDPSAGPVPGLTLGTPAYMSPEHISGVAQIDQRADVYGFGVLLYEALTGQMPFPGEQGPALFDRILNQPAPPVTLFRPDLPPGLVHIIEKAMAKQPDQRYSGLNSMVGALEDELAPATPAPRLLTPIAGVPLVVLRDAASGLHPGPAVQAILKQEPSGKRQETKILFGFPLEKESMESAPNGEANGGSIGGSQEESAPALAGGANGGLNGDSQEEGAGADGGLNGGSQEESAPALDGGADGGSNDGSEEGAPPPTTGRNTVRLRRRPAVPKELFGPASVSFLRGWRGVVGVGSAAVLALVVWMAMRDARPVQTRAVVPVPAPVQVAPAPLQVAPAPLQVAPAPLQVENPTPPASEPAAPPAVPAVEQTTTVPPAVDPAPLAAPPSPPAPSTPATVKPSKPTSHARAVPASVIPSRSRVAVRETSKDPPLRGQSRAASKGDEPARTPSPAPRVGTSPRPAPRAGSLSADDF